MKKVFSKIILLTLIAALCVSVIPFSEAQAAGEKELKILFTHDMHSHLIPAPGENGGEFGGFARLMTKLESERADAEKAGIPCVTVDGGDFSMGSLMQTVFTSEAVELRSLGLMGYDVAAFGNHEYEYRSDGLAKMLNAAMASGDPLPKIVMCNYIHPIDPEKGAAAVKAMADYGVSDYTVIERDGLKIGVFGLMGVDADECAPMSNMILDDVQASAQRVVNEIKAKESCDFIVCCSHSGTNADPKKSEDELLAKNVDGIDFIVSGHTHTAWQEPKVINNTVVGCIGAYCHNLGSVTIKKAADGSNTVVDYRAIPIDENVPDDPRMAEHVANFKTLVEENYLSTFDMKYDEVLCHSDFDFTPHSEFAVIQEEDPLGNIIADAYKYAVEQAEGGTGVPITAAFINSGLVRASIAEGDITVSNVFDISSIGSGADGTPGYPLIDVYLTGNELKNVLELDPSVGPIFHGAQLYSTGVQYNFNMNRMIFNRMTDPMLVLPGGSTAPIDDTALYRVITNLYSSQMLGTVTEKSFGILRITPRDENGLPITDYEARIIKLPNGGELKEWYAVASYISSFPTDESGVPQMLQRYAKPEGRKIRVEEKSLYALLHEANWITALIIILAVFIAALIIFIIYRIATTKRRKAKKSAKKAAKAEKKAAEAEKEAKAAEGTDTKQ